MDIVVPDIGGFEDVPVIEVLVAPGDTIHPEDPLVTLESDKASMDVPAPVGGVVQELKVSVGDTVSAGSVLLTVSPDEPDQAKTTAALTAPAAHEAASRAPAPAASPSDGGSSAYAGPAARRVARELGVDLAAVEGTGRNGRIRTEDVRRARQAPAARPAGGGAVLDLPPWPQVDFAAQGEIEVVPLSRIKRISGPVLARNWAMIPHVTHHDDADITELDAFRKETDAAHRDEGIRVTLLAFLMKAVVASLREFPDVNSSLEGDNLVLKRYYNIGFAADTPNGLVVPVIKGAEGKGVVEIARELGELSAAARAGKLAPGDMQGGTFTISSLGGIGGTGFTPIVNAPEVAILGVTRSAIKPVWQDGAFVPRLMLPLSFSYDHRVIDGAAAARFVRHLATTLEDIRLLLL